MKIRDDASQLVAVLQDAAHDHRFDALPEAIARGPTEEERAAVAAAYDEAIQKYLDCPVASAPSAWCVACALEALLYAMTQPFDEDEYQEARDHALEHHNKQRPNHHDGKHHDSAPLGT